MTVYADALYEAALVFSHLLQRYRPSLTLTANMTGIPKYTANNALEDAGRGLPALLVKFRDFVDRACNTGELGTLRRAAFEENVEETGTQLVIGFKTVDRFLTYYVQQVSACQHKGFIT